MENMQKLMTRLREQPPTVLADLRVQEVRDYLKSTVTAGDGGTRPLDGPVGDMIILDFQAEGNYVAARPSGTEPKVKFYIFAHLPPGESVDLEQSQSATAKWIEQCSVDLQSLVDSV